MKAFCVKCCDETPYVEKTIEVLDYFKGVFGIIKEDVVVPEHVAYCAICGNEVYVESLANKTLEDYCKITAATADNMSCKKCKFLHVSEPEESSPAYCIKYDQKLDFFNHWLRCSDCSIDNIACSFLNFYDKCIDAGDYVDITPFLKVKQNKYYSTKLFDAIVNMSSLNDKINLLYLLAQIGYDETEECERSFVKNCMTSENLDLQEYALNTISIWDKPSFVASIGKVKISLSSLQKEYDGLLEVSENKLKNK